MPLNKHASRRSRSVGAMAALLMLGTASPAFAFNPELEAEIRYQLDCYILLWTDPDLHAETCNPQRPGNAVPLVVTGGGLAPSPPPPPPPPEDEDDDDDEEEIDPCPGGEVNPCGGCYYPT